MKEVKICIVVGLLRIWDLYTEPSFRWRIGLSLLEQLCPLESSWSGYSYMNFYRIRHKNIYYKLRSQTPLPMYSIIYWQEMTIKDTLIPKDFLLSLKLIPPVISKKWNNTVNTECTESKWKIFSILRPIKASIYLFLSISAIKIGNMEKLTAIIIFCALALLYIIKFNLPLYSN